MTRDELKARLEDLRDAVRAVQPLADAVREATRELDGDHDHLRLQRLETPDPHQFDAIAEWEKRVDAFLRTE